MQFVYPSKCIQFVKNRDAYKKPSTSYQVIKVQHTVLLIGTKQQAETFLKFTMHGECGRIYWLVISATGSLDYHHRWLDKQDAQDGGITSVHVTRL